MEQQLTTENKRKCCSCKAELFPAEFYVDKKSKDGLSHRCKKCAKTAASDWQKKNKDRYLIRHAEWSAKNGDKLKASYNKRKENGNWRAGFYRRKYGITDEDYLKMLEAQGGKCFICGSQEPGNKRATRFFVDHNHATGSVRKLLCARCNTGLGSFRDSPELLLSAAAYLMDDRIGMEGLDYNSAAIDGVYLKKQ